MNQTSSSCCVLSDPVCCPAGSEASVVRCLYCKAVLGGDEEMQEHICVQHMSQSSEAFSCPLCSLMCSSQMELQEHLLSCHMESRQEKESGEEEQASTSYTVTTSQSPFFEK